MEFCLRSRDAVTSATDRSSPSKARASKSFALAFGAGGARSLGAIAVIEALDQMGVRPVAISGASLGAFIGAAYAAGMTGKEIRRHALELAHNRSLTFSRLVAARAAPLTNFLAAPFGNPVLIDSGKFCELFLPPAVPDDFNRLQIPLTVIATDLYGKSEMAFSAGDLKRAVAASMAIPGLVKPVEIDGHVLVDGGAVNPLPFDHLRGCADLLIAVDCSGGPTRSRGIPDPWECLFATIQVMGQVIVAEKLKAGGPDFVFHPNVGSFRLLDFFQASAILRAADLIKSEVKTRLSALLAA
jgi:NTE family protein